MAQKHRKQPAENSENKDVPESHKRGGLTPLIAGISAVVIYFLAQVLGINIVALLGAAQGWTYEQVETWLTKDLSARFAIYLVVSLVGIALVRFVLRWRKTNWAAIGLKRPKPQDALYAVAGYAWYLPLFLLASFIVSRLFPAVNLEQAQQLGFDTSTTGAGLVFIFISLVILPPIYEEILARGLLFTGLRRRFTWVAAGLITSLLFAFAHLQLGSGKPPLWPAAIDTFTLSMVLVYLREKTGSLWASIGLHAIKNCLAFTLLFVVKV